MTHHYVAEQLESAATLLRSAGPAFEEAAWRLGAVHPERWVSPAAQVLVDRVAALRTQAHRLVDQHAYATTELTLAAAMARGGGHP